MMSLKFRALASIAIGAVIIAGCGGHGATSSSIPQVQATATAQATFSGAPMAVVYGKSLLSKLTYVGPLQSPAGMSVTVFVRMTNAAGLVQYAMNASTPGSAYYRQWLTPAQIGAQYGASPTDYQTAANYFKSFGLQVGGWPQRQALSVSGSTTQFSRAFGTTFGVYTYLGKKIVAPTGTPMVPSSVPVTAAVGLVHAPLFQRYFLHPNNAAYFGYSPQQIATGFDYSGPFSAGYNGSGIKVGIIGTGPILNSSGHDDDTAGLSAFTHAALAPIVQVAASPQPASAANGGTGTGTVDSNPTNLSTPPPVTNPSCTQSAIPNYLSCNPEDVEAQLDTESVASLAPGSTVLFYMAYNSNEMCIVNSSGLPDPTPPAGPTCPAGETPYPEEGIALSDDEVQQAIADNTADVVSMSFGLPENVASYYGYIGTVASPGLGQVEIASLVAEGMAVFVSSGDNGAWECFDPVSGNYLGTACASYPASDVNAMAVGGVNVPLDQAGNLTGAITAWADNTTLGGDGSFSNNVGSGGGVSSAFTAPAWQTATLGASMRTLPDWSLDADPNTGPAIVFDYAYGNTAPVAIGGTSASAPEAAAMWALVLQACKASASCNSGGTYGYRMGNPAPLLYAIYAKSNPLSGSYGVSGFTPQLGYAQVFYDITYGGNQAAPSTAAPVPASTPNGYNSGLGYDQVTGIGAPFAGHLIQAITGTPVP